jgi:uncharacterized protein YndB with AHSA1/START domain
MRAPVKVMVLIPFLLFQRTGKCEVMSGSASGFLVRNKVKVHAVPDSVYRALVLHVDRWWDPKHTYSGDSRNLSLDPRPGGCFCETLPDGGVRHLEVVFVSPGKTLRMTGAMGPLQGSGLAGSMTFGFQADGDSTITDLTYSVGGYYVDLPQITPVVDSVLRSQLLRLKSYVETGKPVSE